MHAALCNNNYELPLWFSVVFLDFFDSIISGLLLHLHLTVFSVAYYELQNSWEHIELSSLGK